MKLELFKNLPSLPHIDLSGLRQSVFSFAKKNLPKLKIGSTVVELPIIQGGMGVNISLSGLASAVSNHGALGVIAANAIGMLEPDYFVRGREANIRALKKELKKFRTMSDGPVGVNIMVVGNDFLPLLDVCIEERVDVVFLGAGLPIRNIPVERLRAADVKVCPIVSSHRAANIIFKSWQKNYNDIPDAVVVEGPKAGGHLGFKVEQIDDPDFQLDVILPKVLNVIASFEKESGKKIPVIAAGGIFTGEDIYRYLKMGAGAVQMGTRFVATVECDADRRFKDMYVACRAEDISIIQSPVGLPGRAINSAFFKKLETEKRDFTDCPWQCMAGCAAQKARYCIAIALNHARKGNLKEGFAFAGTNAHRIEKIITVEELLSSLKKDYEWVVELRFKKLMAEFEKTVQILADLKKEYGHAVEKALSFFKDKYECFKARSSESLKEEYEEIMERILSLKREYVEQTEKFLQLMHA